MADPNGKTGGNCDADVIAESIGAPEAFGVIFDRHFDVIHRYLARRVGRDRADDLAAQTFIVAFERRGSFRSEALAARPWLFGIATRLLLSERRAERRLLHTIVRLGAERNQRIGSTDSEFLEVDVDLAAALAGMDGDQRDVLLMLAWGELTYEEIAVAMSIPIGTVRSRLSRARTHLRAELAPPPVNSALVRAPKSRSNHG